MHSRLQVLVDVLFWPNQMLDARALRITQSPRRALLLLPSLRTCITSPVPHPPLSSPTPKLQAMAPRWRTLWKAGTCCA